ncbi:MAG TPA: BTAD domain-containing putative transcriptional regulator, partial [Acidimicrobiales bacterium]|nr:BTAD domain-containing putative transcriptional regulator [Acidimicrobiales bacterium]
MATDRGRVRVEVLGPIRAVDGAGRDITPDGALQRRLLALLVLRRGRVVPVDTAVDALWPTAAPRDPVAALQNHVFRLRRGLPDGLISSVGEGYRLDPGLVDLDADRLAAATTAGASDPGADAAAEVIDAILARWHGPAYPELADVDDGRAEAVRLDDLRTRAREALVERRLARGETDGLVVELSSLVDAQPGRETPVALLMAALEATGRRADALRAYDDFRRLLGDELGIEPSPALAARHAELLTSGTAPDATPGAPVASDSTPGGVASDPAPGGAAAGHPPSQRRLPAPPTSLVGRDDLVAEVTELAGAHRVVTLVGPGGVGKTRLLFEAGHRLRDACPDRPVVLCELATAVRPTVADVVADALGIDARPGVPLTERIADLLGDAHVALLLDNCEHVVGPAAELVERLVSTCPHVSVLATSRERLRVSGEQVCTVPTLPVGNDGAPAVQLFVDRARAVAPGFEPDEEARACIAEIVRRLDGLPLAIELAAARLHTHDVAEVAAGLDHRFTLLSSGYRTSSRHASLSAAVS